jgi:hypothetical protein
MISVPAAVMIAILLLLFLLLFAVRNVVFPPDLVSGLNACFPGDAPDLTLCPPEFVARIFSHDDQEFVVATKSSHLEKLFKRERKAVALVWVQQTSAAIRRIMREHVIAARQSKDLELTTEVRLLALYVRLMFVCWVLFAVIYSTGPVWLRGLAVYADVLSQRIVCAQQALGTVTVAREIHGAGRI